MSDHPAYPRLLEAAREAAAADGSVFVGVSDVYTTARGRAMPAGWTHALRELAWEACAEVTREIGGAWILRARVVAVAGHTSVEIFRDGTGVAA